MGTKIAHRNYIHARLRRQPTRPKTCLALIFRLSAGKIHALGNFVLCVAVAFLILTMSLHYTRESSALPSWEKTAIIAGVSSLVSKGLTKVKTK